MNINCMLCDKYICIAKQLAEEKVNAVCSRCLMLLEKQEQRFVKKINWYREILKENVTFEE